MFSSLNGRGRRTFGGLRYWTDIRVEQGWRVQRHETSGECRLLDPSDRVRAHGGRARCVTALRRHVGARGPAGDSGRHLIILVHALASWRSLMAPLERRLRDEGHQVESFGYASTVAPLHHNAAALNAVLDRAGDVAAISFVTHSLGARVVATALADGPAWRRRADVAGIAMMCPPHQPVALARFARGIPPARWFYGPVLDDLADHPTPLDGLADVPLLVIAGEVVKGRNGNGHDGVITHDETMLDLPHERVVVPAIHGLMSGRADVQTAVLEFLRRTAPGS